VIAKKKGTTMKNKLESMNFPEELFGLKGAVVISRHINASKPLSENPIQAMLELVGLAGKKIEVVASYSRGTRLFP
jgi:hypothetical protein